MGKLYGEVELEIDKELENERYKVLDLVGIIGKGLEKCLEGLLEKEKIGEIRMPAVMSKVNEESGIDPIRPKIDVYVNEKRKLIYLPSAEIEEDLETTPSVVGIKEKHDFKPERKLFKTLNEEVGDVKYIPVFFEKLTPEFLKKLSRGEIETSAEVILKGKRRGKESIESQSIFLLTNELEEEFGIDYQFIKAPLPVIGPGEKLKQGNKRLMKGLKDVFKILKENNIINYKEIHLSNILRGEVGEIKEKLKIDMDKEELYT